jgi:hypothetical protein
MAKNKEVINGILEKLALVSEAVQDIFEDTKPTIIYELKNEDFKEIQDNFRDIDKKFNKFTIEISGVNFVIINSDRINEEKENKEEKKENLFSKFKKLFSVSSKLPVKN